MPSGKVLARRDVTPGVLALLPADGLTLLFDTAGYHRIETRVFYDGRGTLRVGPARVTAERIGVDTALRPLPGLACRVLLGPGHSRRRLAAGHRHEAPTAQSRVGRFPLSRTPGTLSHGERSGLLYAPGGHARLLRLRLPLSVHGRRRRAVVSNLAERLAAAGHEVTYLTLRQWERGGEPEIAGVRVVPVGPRLALYSDWSAPDRAAAGLRARRPWTPAPRGRRYDVVHTGSFPYFSLLAAAAARRLHRYRLVVDWFELGRPSTGASTSAGRRALRLAGPAAPRGAAPGSRFSRLSRATLGQGFARRGHACWRGLQVRPSPRAAEPLVVFAGRHIPEKRSGAGAGSRRARSESRRSAPRSSATAPSGREVLRLSSSRPRWRREGTRLRRRGEVGEAFGGALCLALPVAPGGLRSRRGRGGGAWRAELVVGTDNAALELVVDGENGFVARPPTEDIADAIVRVHAAGQRSASPPRLVPPQPERLSLESTLETLLDVYRSLLHVGLNALHLVPGETGGGAMSAGSSRRSPSRGRPPHPVRAEGRRAVTRASPGPGDVELVGRRARPEPSRRVLAEQTLLPRGSRSDIDLLHNRLTTAPTLAGRAASDDDPRPDLQTLPADSGVPERRSPARSGSRPDARDAC